MFKSLVTFVAQKWALPPPVPTTAFRATSRIGLALHTDFETVEQYSSHPRVDEIRRVTLALDEACRNR